MSKRSLKRLQSILIRRKLPTFLPSSILPPQADYTILSALVSSQLCQSQQASIFPRLWFMPAGLPAAGIACNNTRGACVFAMKLSDV